MTDKKRKRTTYQRDGTESKQKKQDTMLKNPLKENGQSFLQNQRQPYDFDKGGIETAKSRQRQQLRRSQTLGHNVQKPDTVNLPESEKDNGMGKASEWREEIFSDGDNFFAQENPQNGEQGFSESYRKKDTYFQSDVKPGYERKKKKKQRQRNYKNTKGGEQGGYDACSADGQGEKGDAGKEFSEKDTTFFGDGKPSDFIPSKKLEKLEKKTEKARKKTAKAKKRLPKKKEYNWERRFNEETGKAEYILTTVETEKPFPSEKAAMRGIQKVTNEGVNIIHGKVAQYEKDNSGVEASHKAEQSAERGFHYVMNHRKAKLQKQRDKVAKLEKKQFRAETNFLYQKYLEENPQMQRTLLRKHMQKERIKREYAKAYQKGKAVKNTKEAAVKSTNTVTAVAKKIQEFAVKNIAVIGTVAAIALLLILIMTAFSSCGAMLGDTISTIVSGSYLSESKEIDEAELKFTKKEMDLQKEIDRIETDYPGYDEYRYNVGEIGHDPFALISYLSALYAEFTAVEVESQLDSLFTEMYTLTTKEVVEIRTRTETHTSTDPETGEESSEDVEVEYEYYILEVTLTVKPLSAIAAGNLDSEQKELFDLYQSTNGNLQQLSSPLDLYWYYYVSSYYGYRNNPSTGQEELHRGLDIAVPEGTQVYAAHTGTVTNAAYDSHYGNYIEIRDSKGIVTKYAHLSSIAVSAGQKIEKETVIGATGSTGSSTGSHLHLEVLFEGVYYNPIFYFATGENTLNGEPSGAGSRPGNVTPPDSYDDATVQALMREAEKYLGMPYTFGGTPPASFDCSAFVCWVFTNSGVRNLPRTTAQGIYDQCTPISASEAKAGDIIFFTGTYNAGRPVTHVGIYCGNGIMVHCGNPIQYASTNTSYWQSHFYGYGRLN